MVGWLVRSLFVGQSLSSPIHPVDPRATSWWEHTKTETLSTELESHFIGEMVNYQMVHLLWIRVAPGLPGCLQGTSID